MVHELTKDLYDRMQKGIVNEDLLDPKLREIKPIVIETLKELPDLEMVGYKEEQVTPKKRFLIEMDDVIQKKGRNNKKDPMEYMDFSVDLEKTKVDILRCYFIIDTTQISDTCKETALTNTKYRIMEVENILDQVFDSELKEEIINREDKYDHRKEKDAELDLLIEVPLLIPRLINGQYYIMDGRKFFSAFYMKKTGTWTTDSETGLPKLKITNIMPRPYKNNDELFSYIMKNENGILRYQFLGKMVNPFTVIGDEVSLYEIFPQFMKTKKKPKDENGQIILDTYNLWKNKERKEYNKEKEKHLNDNDLKDYKYKLLDQLNPKEVVDGIESFLVPDDRKVKFDIHKSLRKFLKIEILERIPNFKNSRRDKADIVKSRINIDPEVVMKTMKKRKQFSSTVADSTNVIDVFKRFAYISELGSGSQIKDPPRRFKMNQMGIVDPVATSTSDNLGLSGMLCFSIDSKYIEGVE